MSHFKLSAGNKGHCTLPQPDFGITQNICLELGVCQRCPEGTGRIPGISIQNFPCICVKICFIAEQFPSWQQGGSGSAVFQGEGGLSDLGRKPGKILYFPGKFQYLTCVFISNPAKNAIFSEEQIVWTKCVFGNIQVLLL